MPRDLLADSAGTQTREKGDPGQRRCAPAHTQSFVELDEVLTDLFYFILFWF